MSYLKNIILVLLTAIFLIKCTVLTSRHSASVLDKTVLCTFDDGPNAYGRTTESVLDVLKHHTIKGYFCVIGMNVERNPGIVKRIYTEGHCIVNHGYTDEFILFKSNRTIKKEIIKCNNAIGCALGIKGFSANYFRPARGFYRLSTKKVLHELGMELLPISFYTLDAERSHKSAGKVIHQTIKRVRKDKGGIIILHDGKNLEDNMLDRIARDSTSSYNRTWIPEAVDSIITILKAEGYTFK